MKFAIPLFERGGAPGLGGALFVDGGTAKVERCTFQANTAQGGSGGTGGGTGGGGGGGGGAGLGGAIFQMSGSLTVKNSTFSGNSAIGKAKGEGHGAGLFVLTGSATLHYNTFSGNTNSSGQSTASDTVHVYAGASSLDLVGNIMANTSGGGDCWNDNATLTSSFNLIENGSTCLPTLTDDPQLGSLTTDGGPTERFPIDSSSPAFDAAEADCFSATDGLDQRQLTRPVSSSCDMGSLEVQADEIAADNCPDAANPDQVDSDSDGVGDACDNCQMPEQGTLFLSADESFVNFGNQTASNTNGGKQLLSSREPPPTTMERDNNVCRGETLATPKRPGPGICQDWRSYNKR